VRNGRFPLEQVGASGALVLMHASSIQRTSWPVGYADAIVVALVLRSVVRRAGLDAVRAHWPGTKDGFAALIQITGLDRQAGGSQTGAP